jgi:phosphoenolpyruvate-protein phosphotransferase (PTS system enzyme I)
MQELVGKTANPGVAVGPAFLVDATPPFGRHLGEESIDAAEARLHAAIAEVVRETEAWDYGAAGLIELKRARLEALRDPAFGNTISVDLRTRRYSVEYALHGFFAARLRANQSDSLKARDLKELEGRLLRALRKSRRVLPARLVLIGEEVRASDVEEFRVGTVIAIVTERGTGGVTGEVAMQFGVPAVAGVRTITSLARDGDTVIVDGTAARVLVRPDDETLRGYPP